MYKTTAGVEESDTVQPWCACRSGSWGVARQSQLDCVTEETGVASALEAVAPLELRETVEVTQS
jgi:hypothetical protein